MTMTEEEMRQALFGSGGHGVSSAVQNTSPQAAKPAFMRKEAKNFVPKLIVTLRVGNEFEGTTELIKHEADTLSRLQAELDAMKIARKKYKYVELVSVLPAK
ncbi:hypothetical protein L6218_14960 [Pseudomonas syringae pv. syringae]|uniref:hypothetical protein n=1 Tax=Pseudomonas TaxID=286 RepID=UPI001F0FFB5C|nr:hypothetical protein [Pseudomonas syringae]MCH5499520.1 hypothetical protein [Pseudomonas syringae pv. syringae]MCH5525665.1 hypothetical protein [Pseudomonas syringae pv. syringae]MCH5560761.1 hypothetical protein [Pseudomonas syringae pv. syringae]MCH5566011.1 hypothetical protein [Pseudomonas syringae pv. syringae]MCH5581285.1 hypothetical protein [Pseudomonas syringae pv. syringae]